MENQTPHPMMTSYQNIYDKLQTRALDFHRLLLKNGVYIQDFPETEFLARISHTIVETAQWIAGNNEDPWLYVLGFPETLLPDLSDVLFMAQWSATESEFELFDELEKLFDRTQFKFRWKHHKELKEIHFQIDSESWVVRYNNIIHLNEYQTIDPYLYNYLSAHGWVLYQVAGFDTAAEFLLMPILAVEALKNYLIAAYPEDHPLYDERIEWFIHPDTTDLEKPEDIWQI